MNSFRISISTSYIHLFMLLVTTSTLLLFLCSNAMPSLLSVCVHVMVLKVMVLFELLWHIQHFSAETEVVTKYFSQKVDHVAITKSTSA